MRWQEEPNIIDMSAYRDEDLLEQGMLGIFLLVLKHIYDEDINGFAKKLLPKLAKIKGGVEKSAFLEAILSYWVAGSKKANVSELNQNAVKLLGSKLGGAVMTTAEMLIEEGKIEEKIEIAKKMIVRGLDDEAIMDCTQLTRKQILALRRDGKLSGKE